VQEKSAPEKFEIVDAARDRKWVLKFSNTLTDISPQ
jgi:hypothetical protein